MSARFTACVLLAGSLAATGCIEPSGIDNADELFAAVSARDGGATGGSPDGGGVASDGDSGKGTGDGGAASNGCGDMAEQYVTKTCGTEFCHGKSAVSALSLIASDVPAGLVGKAASATCSGEFYIDPDAPMKSLIYTKLGANPPCGSRMPLGGTPATAAQQACILEWLTDAAASAPAAPAADAGM